MWEFLAGVVAPADLSASSAAKFFQEIEKNMVPLPEPTSPEDNDA